VGEPRGGGDYEPFGDLESVREHDGRKGQRMSDDDARAVLGGQWQGLSEDQPVPSVFDLGPVRFLDVDIDTPAMQPELEEQTETETEIETESGRVAMVVGANEREYLVDFEPSVAFSQRVSKQLDEELAQLAQEIERASHAAPDEVVEKSLVGPENRKRLGINDAADLGKTSWMAAIGMLTNDANFNTQQCTGTLIRKDVLLTAAHCLVVWHNGATVINQLAFHPRADGTTADKFPWGNWRWRVKGYSYPAAYTSGSCHKPNGYTGACQQSDWALIRVTKPAAASAHNYFFAVATQEIADMNNLKNRGYPICSQPSPPPNCVKGTLYGDSGVCTLGSAVGNDAGYATRVAHGCDASRGHSGSALYRYINGVPTIGGVHITDSGQFGNIENKNWMRRVTPGMVTVINNTVPMLP
jgi:V8-like Glu-specific endopeptidase